MKKVVSVIVFLLCASISAQSKTMVWKVEKNGEHVFIGGTIHVLRPADKIPPGYYQAYQNSDQLVFELDFDELLGAAFKLASLGQAKPGETLDKVLRPEVLKQFTQFCQDYKFPVDPFMKMKPTMVSIQVAMALMMREGVRPEGVDMLFFKRSKADGKSVLALETADQQFDALFNHKADPNEIILMMIKDAQDIDTLLNQLVNSIFEGDSRTLELKMLKPMQQNSPEFYNSLIVTRNNAWIPKIEVLFETPETELILVGALHLVGDIGVIQQLKDKGYTVTQLD